MHVKLKAGVRWEKWVNFVAMQHGRALNYFLNTMKDAVGSCFKTFSTAIQNRILSSKYEKSHLVLSVSRKYENCFEPNTCMSIKLMYPENIIVNTR